MIQAVVIEIFSQPFVDSKEFVLSFSHVGKLSRMVSERELFRIASGKHPQAPSLKVCRVFRGSHKTR